MRLFRRSASDDDTGLIIAERCWHDPDLDTLMDRLEQPGDAEGRVYAALTALATVRDDPERRVQLVEAAAQRLTDARLVLRIRTEARTGDPRTDADALALYSDTMVRFGWGIRGSAQARWVRKDAWGPFFAALGEADQAGAEALELEPAHPAAAVARLVSARGLQLPMEEHWSRLEVACRTAPSLYPAHHQFLQQLCRKWSGSHEMMFGFARSRTEQAGIGDPIGSLLAMAWLERELHGADASETDPDRRADQEIVEAAADRWTAGGEAALAHPRALEAHQLIGWFLLDRPDRARFHLSRTWGRIACYPWDYRIRSQHAFRTALASVGATLS